MCVVWGGYVCECECVHTRKHSLCIEADIPWSSLSTRLHMEKSSCTVKTLQSRHFAPAGLESRDDSQCQMDGADAKFREYLMNPCQTT
jgi:hypothetical protein